MKIGSISGSLTRLINDTSYLVEGSNITIVTQSNGSIMISSTGGGGSGVSYFDSTTTDSIFTTGSAAFVGQEGLDSPLDVGADVFFYVSGSVDSRGTSVPGVAAFGGDVVITGSLFVPGNYLEVSGTLAIDGNYLEITGTLSVDGGISGSLTKLSDGTSYLVAGDNITIFSQSNGSILISANTGDSFFDSTTAGSIFTTGSAAFVGQEGLDSPLDVGADVFFYVSGSVDSRTTSTPGVAAFGGDVVITGSLYMPGNYFELSGTLAVEGGITGSLTLLSDGTSYLVAGDNVTIVSQSNGSVLISSNPGDSFFNSTTAGSIFTTGSAAFVGQEGLDSPLDVGTDVFFYVSGSVGSRNTSTPGVAVFGGDVVITGSLFVPVNELIVTGTIAVEGGITGSLTLLSDGTSYLVAGNNISIVSQSNGSVLISNTFTQVDDFFDSTTAGSIFTSGSVAFVGPNDEWGVVDSPLDKGSEVFFYVSGSTAATRSKVSLFGGSVFVSGAMVQGNFILGGGSTGQYAAARGERTNATGTSAHAEGRFSLAQGNHSHAEGDSTAAYGISSHVEGLDSATYGNYSHAEGRSTEARGAYSHAEGRDPVTYGDYSHAEGRDTLTTSTALYSHAEGYGSITVGEYSHAEGLYTIASGSNQLVVGKYNVRDNTSSLFVVGNGTGDTNANRSDAIRVETDGLSLGRFEVTGSVIVTKHYAGNAETLTSAATVVNPNVHMSLLDSSGGIMTATLGDGTHVGQIKLISMLIESGVGTSTVSVTTTVGTWSTLSFGAKNETATLAWTGASGWTILSVYGTSVS